MKHLTPFLITLIFLGAGCKSRKISLVRTDSVVTTSSSAKVHTETTRKDSTTTKTETHSKTTDTSSSTVTIVPDSGSVVSVTVTPQTEFVFKGKAKSITYSGKKGVTDNTNSVQLLTSAQVANIIKDSTGQSQTKTELHKKVKDVTSTPNYSWILWVVVAFIVFGAACWVYRKFF